jgi:hypothetical protein
MPKRHKVRVTNELQDEIRKLNRQVVKKKSYLKTTYGIMTETHTRQITEFDYKTDLTAYKNEMKKFLNRNFNREKTHLRNKEGKLFPINEVKEIKKEIARVNRLKEKERKKVEALQVYHRGKLRGTVGQVQGAGDDRLDRFAPLKFNLDRFRSVKEFKKYVSNIKEVFEGNFILSQDETYRESYIKSLKNKFGDDPEFEGDINRIIKKVSSMGIDEYMHFYYTKTFTKLGFIYDKTDARKKLNAMLNDWNIPLKDEGEKAS